MAKLIWFFKRVSYRTLAPLFPETISKWRIQEVAKNYNMYTEENEEYYAKLYFHIIKTKFQQVFGNKKLKILDAGCGQGRLSIPLAIMGHTVEGIDFSPDAIKLAKKYAAEKNLNNIYFDIKDIDEPFNDDMSERYDCILCTEVIYMVKDYNKVLSELYRMLKTNGLMFIAFREKYFYLLYYIKNKRFKDAKFILSNSKTMSGLNVHTHKEILEILFHFRLKDIEFHGIGICSGIEGDPLSSIVEPKNLTSDEQKILFEIETSLSKEYSKAGRYILTSAVK
ncbi:putative S-adenosylmethionine-dependent methyltransferase [uncultured archaeon]|nr:putative S-adenosylmethionine-dependent methyltransferase [uncultured archaeon]